MTDAHASIRTRHKQETLVLIHETAEALALDRGLSETKVEDIATIAGISRRTFFNYFPTKEDAILGIQQSYLPEGARERFYQSNEDLLARTVTLVCEVMKTSSVPGSSHESRRELWRRYPELTVRFKERAADAQSVILPVLVEYCTDMTLDMTEQEVNALLNLAGVILQSAYRSGPVLNDEVVADSLLLFKTTLRKVL